MNELSPYSSRFPSLSATPYSNTPCLTRATSRTNLTTYYMSDPGVSDPISDLFLDVAAIISRSDSIGVFIEDHLGVFPWKDSSVRQTEVLEDLQGKIDPGTFQQIQSICTSKSSSEAACKSLVAYVEYIQRKGDIKLAEVIIDWVVESALLSVLGSPNEDLKQAFLSKIGELYDYKQELLSFKPQEIHDSWIRSIITPMRLNIPILWIGREVSNVKSVLNKFLEEQIFNPQSDCILEKECFGIWMHKNEDGSSNLICYPRSQRGYENVPEAIEVFIPAQATEISAPKNVELIKTDEAHCLKELENRELLASLPSSELYISPDPLIHLGTPCFFKKEPGFTNLEKSLPKLKPLERVKVCLNLLSAVEFLEKGGFVCSALKASDIVIQKDGKVKLDSLFHLKYVSSSGRYECLESLDEKRLDLLAREKGFVSLDTGRYGLILLICEMFFLDLEDLPRTSVFESVDEVLRRFKAIASPSLYRSVDAIAEEHLVLNEGFLKDVLALYSLRKHAKKESGKEDLEGEILKQFIANIVLFPFVNKLLEATLSIEESRKKMLDQGLSLDTISLMDPILSLEEIHAQLEEGKAKVSLLLHRLES